MVTARAHLWILNGKVPEACTDLLRWAQWFETAQRHVADDTLMAGDVRISTIFLGLDHNFSLAGPPLLFESMVFGEEHLVKIFRRERLMRDDLEMWRYATWDEAETGHRKLVERYRALIAEGEELVWAIKNRGTVGQ